MIALSTSFKPYELKEGKALLQKLESFEIGGIELEYRLDESIFQQIKPILKHFDFKVVSVHNFFPAPVDRGLPQG